MIDSAVVIGLGLPGWRIIEGLLRLGVRTICCDPKPVTARTVERVWSIADIGRPKSVAALRAAHNLGLGALLDSRVGRFEHVVGGQDIRAADAIFIVADRPSAIYQATELSLQAASPTRPLHVITANVSAEAAQTRHFILPSERGACPLCFAGPSFKSSFLADYSFSCERISQDVAPDMGGGDQGEGGSAVGGDRYTVPFGSDTGNAAAALALAALDAAAGIDTTLSLAGEPVLFNSRLSRDPECVAACATTRPWPEVAATIPHDAPLGEALSRIAREQELPGDDTSVRFLRGVAVGSSCGCGVRNDLTMLVSPCDVCHGPVAPLRGWAYELPLSLIAERGGGASAASMELPARELILLGDGARRVTVGTE